MNHTDAIRAVAEAARTTYHNIRALRKAMPTRTQQDRTALTDAIRHEEAAWWDNVAALFADAKRQHWEAYEADIARARAERPATFLIPDEPSGEAP